MFKTVSYQELKSNIMQDWQTGAINETAEGWATLYREGNTVAGMAINLDGSVKYLLATYRIK